MKHLVRCWLDLEGSTEMTCSRCKTSRVVEITVTIAERPVRMRSCSYCDTRWWDSEGESLPLPRVLELATKPR